MKRHSLNSVEFITICIQFALVTAITALFFAFAGYLQALGIDAASIGLILGTDALAALVAQPVIASLIHDRSARAWFVGGAVLLALALVLLAQVTSVSLLIAVRLMQGLGFICVISALMALLVQVIPQDMSGRAFGWVSLVRLIPYAIVPFVVDFVAADAASFPRLLYCAAAMAVVPVGLLLFLPSPQAPGRAELSSPPGLSGLAESLGSAAVLVLLFSCLLFFCGYAAVFFFLKQFVGQNDLGNASLFFSTMTLVMFVVRLASWLFDRYSKKLLCAGALMLVAISYALLPWCTTGTELVGVAIISGLGGGIAMPLQAALMFDLSAPRARAMNQNLLVVMMQGGFFLGPLSGGFILEHWNFTVFFVLLAGLTVLSAGLLLWLRPQQTH